MTPMKFWHGSFRPRMLRWNEHRICCQFSSRLVWLTPGGKGLFFILEGMLRYIHGEPLDAPTATVQPLSAMNLKNAMEDIEPGQDFEVVVDFVPTGELNLKDFYAELEKMGTSIQVGEGEGMYRMHIHVPTENRNKPTDYIMSLGTITKIAMENSGSPDGGDREKIREPHPAGQSRTGTDRNSSRKPRTGHLTRLCQSGGGCHRGGGTNDEPIHERYFGRLREPAD